MRPPELPINNTEDYFDKLLHEVSSYFDDKNIALNFNGFKETVKEYSTLNPTDFNECWRLSRDFNMWGEYFSNLKALTEKLYLDIETEKKREFACASIKEDSNKVANGDRLANKNLDVVALRKNRNTLKAFITALDSNIEFAYKAHHHCKETCKYLGTPGNSLITT